mgnify:CR=1 FL=1
MTDSLRQYERHVTRRNTASKQHANKPAQRLHKSPQFQQRLRSYFTTELELSTADRVLKAYDMPQVCQRCLYVDCDGYCQPDHASLQAVNKVKRALRKDPDFANSFREAVFDEVDRDGRAPMAPVNAESFHTHSVPGLDSDSD